MKRLYRHPVSAFAASHGICQHEGAYARLPACGHLHPGLRGKVSRRTGSHLTDGRRYWWHASIHICRYAQACTALFACIPQDGREASEFAGSSGSLAEYMLTHNLRLLLLMQGRQHRGNACLEHISAHGMLVRYGLSASISCEPKIAEVLVQRCMRGIVHS